MQGIISGTSKFQSFNKLQKVVTEVEDFIKRLSGFLWCTNFIFTKNMLKR